VVIMVIIASSKYKIARSAPSEDSLCAGWVPFRENNGGLSDENGGFLHAQLGSGRAHTSASLHLSGILFYVSNQMSKVKPTTCLYRKSRWYPVVDLHAKQRMISLHVTLVAYTTCKLKHT